MQKEFTNNLLLMNLWDKRDRLVHYFNLYVLLSLLRLLMNWTEVSPQYIALQWHKAICIHHLQKHRIWSSDIMQHSCWQSDVEKSWTIILFDKFDNQTWNLLNFGRKPWKKINKRWTDFKKNSSLPAPYGKQKRQRGAFVFFFFPSPFPKYKNVPPKRPKHCQRQNGSRGRLLTPYLELSVQLVFILAEEELEIRIDCWKGVCTVHVHLQIYKDWCGLYFSCCWK